MKRLLRTTGALAVAGGLALAGCTDATSGTAITAPPDAALAAAPADPSQQLASVLARGLARPEARAQLRNALRESPYAGHRLELSAFLSSRAGEALLSAAARESGVPREKIDAWLAALPPSDVVVPFRAHRLAWTGGEEVRLAVVAVEDDAATSLPVFARTGEQGLLTPGDGVPPYALVVIAPAEHKMRRPGSPSAGFTIQGPEEPEAFGEFTTRGPDGRMVTYPVEVMMDDGICMQSHTGTPSIQGCSGGEYVMPAPPAADTTILSSFEIHGGHEPFWDSEMEPRFLIQHYYYTPPGNERQLMMDGTLRFTGIRANRYYSVQRIAMFSRVRETGQDGIAYWLDELDLFFNDWLGFVECRQLDGCQANNIPLPVQWKSSDCSGSSADYNVGCRRVHTATVTTRWTPKYP